MTSPVERNTSDISSPYSEYKTGRLSGHNVSHRQCTLGESIAWLVAGALIYKLFLNFLEKNFPLGP